MNTVSLDSMDQAKRTLIDLAIRYGPRLFTAMVTLAVGYMLAQRTGRLVARWLARRDLEEALRRLIGRMITAFVLLVFALMALQNLGIELLPLLASLGVVGVGAGLAMQGMLSNLVAGLTIIFSQPFRIGEYIAVIGVEGQVESIDLFTTTLVHTDRSQVIVPNRKILGEVLHNYGKLRQLSLSLGVAYGTDLGRALLVIRDVLSRSGHALADPAPVVGVSHLGDSSVVISVRPWVPVAQYVEAVGHINRALAEACSAHNIRLAPPQREVRILSAASDSPTVPPAPAAVERHDS